MFFMINEPIIFLSNLLQYQLNAIESIKELKCESPYQIQYQKNIDLVKAKYKKFSFPTISYQEIFRCLISFQKISCKTNEDEKLIILGQKIYCFLCSLAFYEVDNNKFRDFFENEDWNRFAENNRFLSKMEIFSLKDEIFKKNMTNYKWTAKEDLLLKNIICKYESSKLSWIKISNEFNEFPLISQLRTPAHCQERWKNTLGNSFKKGEWTIFEDSQIIEFVIKSGTKWSRLSSMMSQRTEHDCKNRFFSILSRIIGLPIRQIKQTLDYREKKFLNFIKGHVQM